MAFLGTEKIKDFIRKEKIIEPEPLKIQCGSCELSLGNEVFMTDSSDRKKKFLNQDKEQVVINPGQFALLLTHESVHIPISMIAFISIKAGIKLKGLLNVSGFHVDPGFKGKLVFSVYNAGSSPISLAKGEPCFLIWFSELDIKPEEKSNYADQEHEHKNQDSIPLKYIDALLAGELASPTVLSKRIDDNQKELDNRIKLIEKEQTAKDYLVKTAVGLGIILLMKFGFDWITFDNGFKKGLELKQKQIETESVINELLIQKKQLLIDIDTLKKEIIDSSKK
ncbi:MAG: deoxycytidine triphosphate deaminase [Bacteroidota bacterium]